MRIASGCLFRTDPSSEFLRLRSTRSLSTPSPLLGFLPSSRHHPVCPLAAKVATPPLRSVLRRSQPLDGLLHTRLRRLVSSCSRVQGIPVQGLLSLRSGLPRRKYLPPCRWLDRSSATEVTVQIHRTSTSRSWSVQSRVPTQVDYSSPRMAAPLFRFQLLQVFSLPPSRLPGIVRS